MSTIKEVAQAAGVSVKTVSRYLSGYQGIRDTTRDKIRNAIESLDYHPSAAAQSLRGVGSKVIAMVADYLSAASGTPDIIRGAQQVCGEHGKLLMVGETGGSKESFNTLMDGFQRQRVEAILFATAAHSQVSIDRDITRCPLVLINCFDSARDLPHVTPDDFNGSYEATRALLDAGHSNIAMIGLPADMISGEQRRRGYEKAMLDSSAQPASILFRNCESGDGENSFEGLPDILDEVLALQPRPTALMLGNDEMAMRTMQLLAERDISVPADISLVGYDDCQLIATNLLPQLATVKLPYYEMGRTAALLAIEGENVQKSLHCPFVPRASMRSL